MEPRVRVTSQTPSRCSYCKDELTAEQRVACASCLAPLHAECWRAHGRCPACGATPLLERAGGAAVEAAPPVPYAVVTGDRRMTIVSACLGACAVAAVAAGRSGLGFVLLALAFALLLHASSRRRALEPPRRPTTPRVDKAGVDRLIAALSDPVALVRENAAFALGWVTGDKAHAVPALVRALEDPAPAVRAGATVALAFLSDRPESVAALPALERLLEEPGGPPDDGGRPPVPRRGSGAGGIARHFKEDRRGSRAGAAYAIGQIGARHGREPARALLPALARAATDPDPDVRAEALGTVRILAPPTDQLVPALLAALRDPSAAVRGAACWALGDPPHRPAEVVPALLPLLRDKDTVVRAGVAYALGRFGRDAASAAPALLAALAEAQGGALEQPGHDYVSGAPACSALCHDERGVRAGIVWALGELRAATPEVLDAVSRALSDEEPAVRVTAAESLALLGREGARPVG